jgi:hypothetical protein
VKGLAAVALLVAALSLAACGGGGGKKTNDDSRMGAVTAVQLAEKIGLVSNGQGEYRLGGCTVDAVLASPAQIARAKAAGKKVVTDPTGHYGVEIEDQAGCAKAMKGAVGILNVP